jgi:hypothetical protein
MKHFVYLENQEGGMSEVDFQTADELGFLYGWMNKRCRSEDERLVEWLEEAEVGEKFNHRLGTVVRLKDEYN